MKATYLKLVVLTIIHHSNTINSSSPPPLLTLGNNVLWETKVAVIPEYYDLLKQSL